MCDLRLVFRHLLLEPHHFGELGTVLGEPVQILLLQQRRCLFQFLQQFVVGQGGDLAAIGKNLIVERLFLNAVALRGGQITAQVRQHLFFYALPVFGLRHPCLRSSWDR